MFVSSLSDFFCLRPWNHPRLIKHATLPLSANGSKLHTVVDPFLLVFLWAVRIDIHPKAFVANRKGEGCPFQYKARVICVKYAWHLMDGLHKYTITANPHTTFIVWQVEERFFYWEKACVIGLTRTVNLQGSFEIKSISEYKSVNLFCLALLYWP